MRAIVTGASSGIGREIAVLLAGKGYDLVLVARRRERLEKLKAGIEKRYGVAVTVEAVDLSAAGEAGALMDRHCGGTIDVLVNNAGFGKLGYFEDIPLEKEEEMIRTNLAAVHILMKRFVQSQDRGYILNVASIAGLQPGPVFAAYSATKAYVLSLSQAVNYEMKCRGIPITVTALCPGPVKTEFDAVAGTDFALNQISAGKCARAGVSAMLAGKALAFSDIRTRLAHAAVKVLPGKLTIAVNYRIQTSKQNKGMKRGHTL